LRAVWGTTLRIGGLHRELGWAAIDSFSEHYRLASVVGFLFLCALGIGWPKTSTLSYHRNLPKGSYTLQCVVNSYCL